MLLPDHLEEQVDGKVIKTDGEPQAGDPFLAALLDDVEQDVRAQAAQESPRSVPPDRPVVTSRRPVSDTDPSRGLARVRYGLD